MHVQSLDWDRSHLERFLSTHCNTNTAQRTTRSNTTTNNKEQGRATAPSPGLLHPPTNDDAFLWHAVEQISSFLNDDTTDAIEIALEGHTLLGGLFLTLLRPTLAITAYLNALWIATASSTSTTLTIAMALHRLAKAYTAAGRYTEAIPALQKALQIYQTVEYSDHHHDVLEARQLLVQAKTAVSRRLKSRKLEYIREES